MKYILIIFLIFILAGCTKNQIAVLNKSISDSRSGFPKNKKIKYRSDLYSQNKFRQFFLENLEEKYHFNFENRKDTIILVEYFDNICANCNYEEITVLIGNISYQTENINWKNMSSNYKIVPDTIQFRTHSNLIDNGMWKLLINKNVKNPFAVELYKTNCLDGGNANITWILPDKTCHSINANCF
jgi:hypothetical protein